MTVFVAYFDAAGDPEDPNVRVLSIAGWIAPEAKWRRLEREWRKACDRERVSGLHMKDFAHSTGEYKNWKGDETRRKQFLSDLIRIIRTSTNRDFSQDMFLDGYRAVNAQFEFSERVGHPYGISAIMCISAVREWMVKTHPTDDVLFVFEKGDGHQSEVIEQLTRDKIDLGIDLQFIRKRDFVNGSIRTVPALEAADFLAYENHKTLTDVYLKQKTKARGSASALKSDGNLFGVIGRGAPVIDGRFFEIAAQGFNLPRRPDAVESSIPREFEALASALKDSFHGTPARDIRIVPTQEPLSTLKKSVK